MATNGAASTLASAEQLARDAAVNDETLEIDDEAAEFSETEPA
jgi:hypothetical protein